jgi:phosphoenolpyruvate carboxykinase (GTP)
MTTNPQVLAFVNEAAIRLKPAKIHWCDGSDAEKDALTLALLSSGKATPLDSALRPDCLLFRSDPSDVARVENRTFVATRRFEDAGPTNRWIDPVLLKATMRALFEGAMEGRTLYVIAFSMGPIDSPYARIGVQLTDSEYVVLNMRIMTRMGRAVWDKLDQGASFVSCLHSIGFPLKEGATDPLWPCAPIEQKYISHFPEERLIWSYGSGYGGNALLGKKCFALRIASAIARDEGWLAEHMMIVKVTNPNGRVKYFTGAFPSACGKTNLAMPVPTLPGWKVETVGDDIAWMHIGPDGRLWAINPEAGFFGVAPGTSEQTNPNAMATIRSKTIFTNVALKDDGDVWWEGLGPSPEHAVDWTGKSWSKNVSTPAAHPNARFTAAASNCPSIAPEWEDPQGVPISAILFGGRRPSTVPLVVESFDWAHGVFFGSVMGSEITAATISNQIGTVRRDPFAMLPFIGYHVGDYLAHWLSFSKRTDPAKLPRIYSVNWFRKDRDGRYLWPGFGENARILKWIFERCDHVASSMDTPIGRLPRWDDLDLEGIALSDAARRTLLDVDLDAWQDEVSSIEQSYASIGDRLPNELKLELNALKQRLAK